MAQVSGFAATVFDEQLDATNARAVVTLRSRGYDPERIAKTTGLRLGDVKKILHKIETDMVKAAEALKKTTFK